MSYVAQWQLALHGLWRGGWDSVVGCCLLPEAFSGWCAQGEGLAQSGPPVEITHPMTGCLAQSDYALRGFKKKKNEQMGTSEQIWGLGHSLMDFVVPKCVVAKRMPLLGTFVAKPLQLSLQLFYKSKTLPKYFFLKKNQNRTKKTPKPILHVKVT